MKYEARQGGKTTASRRSGVDHKSQKCETNSAIHFSCLLIPYSSGMVSCGWTQGRPPGRVFRELVALVMVKNNK